MAETVSHIFRGIRHGQARSNENRIDFQGAAHRALTRPGELVTNTLADKGILQARAGGLALRKAEIHLEAVTSSTMCRAVQTAREVGASYKGDIELLPPIANLEEVSHGAWEPGIRDFVLTRKQAAELTRQRHTAFMHTLRSMRTPNELIPFAGWVIPRGDSSGETPLQAAIRYLDTLTTRPASTTTLTVVHGMGMRFAIETGSLTATNRAELSRLSSAEASPQRATLEALKEMGAPSFEMANNGANKLRNGEYVEARVTEEGSLLATRRIFPELPSNAPLAIENITLVEQQRGDDQWHNA